MTTGIYYQLYALLSAYIYGADAVLTGEQVLTLTQVSTIGALVIVALPFVVVFWIIRKVFG